MDDSPLRGVNGREQQHRQQQENGTPRLPQSFSQVLQRNRQKYYDGLVAVVLFFVWQLLICGLQQMTATIDDFPAPILAMLLVAALMILASRLFVAANLDGLYRTYLRGPTDLLNRHMSIGFTVPFTMIMDGPMSSSRNIGLIIAGYIITGLLNTVLVFALSLGLQTALMSINNSSRKDTLAEDSLSSNNTPPPADLSPPPVIPAMQVDSCSSLGSGLLGRQPSRQAPAQGHAPAPVQDRVQSYVSESTTLTNNPPSIHSGSDGETDVERVPSPLGQQPPQIQAEHGRQQQPPQQLEPEPVVTTSQRLSAALQNFARRLACFAAANPILCCSLAGIPLVGVPVALRAGSDTALDTFLLVFLWTATLAAQAAVRRCPFVLGGYQYYPRARNVLATLLNAVLWSSLGTIAYLAAKAAARHRTIDDALATFSTGTTLADLMAGTNSGKTTGVGGVGGVGAGDLASSILDAGIVSWGLKLFECRTQLLSRAGVTTLAVGAVFAAANIVCGPLLVHHALGLASPAKSLAFAARSVTLALAGPAMKNLGGDVGLNAAMVVFNGIVFQVAMGLGVCRWVSSRLLSAAGREGQARSGTPEAGFRRGRLGSACWRSQSQSETDTGTETDTDTETGSESGTDTETETETETAAPDGSKPGRGVSTCDAATLTDRSSPTSAASAALSSSSDAFKDVEKTAGQPSAAPTTSSAPSTTPPRKQRPTSYSKCGDACIVHMRGGDLPGLEKKVERDDDSPSTVAAGMTVGINAAAMGTAYLYEDGSRAAPYAALSMTVFGVMTVVFTSIQPLAGWVVASVG